MTRGDKLTNKTKIHKTFKRVAQDTNVKFQG